MSYTDEYLADEVVTRRITAHAMRGFTGAVAESIGRSIEHVSSWNRITPDAIQKRSPFHYVRVAVSTVCQFGGAEQMREYLIHLLKDTPWELATKAMGAPLKGCPARHAHAVCKELADVIQSALAGSADGRIDADEAALIRQEVIEARAVLATFDAELETITNGDK